MALWFHGIRALICYVNTRFSLLLVHTVYTRKYIEMDKRCNSFALTTQARSPRFIQSTILLFAERNSLFNAAVNTERHEHIK